MTWKVEGILHEYDRPGQCLNWAYIEGERKVYVTEWRGEKENGASAVIIDACWKAVDGPGELGWLNDEDFRRVTARLMEHSLKLGRKWHIEARRGTPDPAITSSGRCESEGWWIESPRREEERYCEHGRYLDGSCYFTDTIKYDADPRMRAQFWSTWSNGQAVTAAERALITRRLKRYAAREGYRAEVSFR